MEQLHNLSICGAVFWGFFLSPVGDVLLSGPISEEKKKVCFGISARKYKLKCVLVAYSASDLWVKLQEAKDAPGAPDPGPLNGL